MNAEQIKAAINSPEVDDLILSVERFKLSRARREVLAVDGEIDRARDRVTQLAKKRTALIEDLARLEVAIRDRVTQLAKKRTALIEGLARLEVAIDERKRCADCDGDLSFGHWPSCRFSAV